jgi:hypothetical protein
MTDAHFSSQEMWSEIRDFPGYSVSNLGRVSNTRFDRLVTPTMNSSKIVMVGMMRDGKQCKRALAHLVAEAFVPRDPKQETFDTVINLNGDGTNCQYDNLAWRPLWFAREYKKQFTANPEIFTTPVQDTDTGMVFESSMHAAMAHGLLAIDVIHGAIDNVRVWPTGQLFATAFKKQIS